MFVPVEDFGSNSNFHRSLDRLLLSFPNYVFFDQLRKLILINFHRIAIIGIEFYNNKDVVYEFRSESEKCFH
uniref:Uncharacterized protein n=1 Tax=Onchocerca volvulus TaxID=6282 RepID=A0A8R1Y0A0_ONCVO